MEVSALVNDILAEVIEMIEWTIAQGQRPSASVHLIISIIEGQIFLTNATTSSK
jgi:hypothetical protein